MAGPANRLRIGSKPLGKAHFLRLAAQQASEYVRKWREEVPEQWGPTKRELNVDALREVLVRAQRLGLDPYLVLYVVMGAEWLFRARPLTQGEIDGALDEIEARIRHTALADSREWVASLIVGAIAGNVGAALTGTRYLVGFGQWAIPARGWRTVVSRIERGRKRTTVAVAAPTAKSGKPATLSPIVAGVVVERLGEETCGPRGGGTALALKVASILRGQTLQLAALGTWRWVASGAPPPSLAGGLGDPPPANLGDWLARRWRNSYDRSFSSTRTWSTFLVQAAHNPLGLFSPLGDADLVSQLYDMSWYRRAAAGRRLENC